MRNQKPELFLYEIFELVKKARNKADMISILQENNTIGLRDFLKGSFDDSVQFNLPSGLPPYTPAAEGQGLRPSVLTPTMRNFVKGLKGDRAKSSQRESAFLNILQKAHPKDVDFFCKMKEKKMKGVVRGMSKILIKEAFDGLIKD